MSSVLLMPEPSSWARTSVDRESPEELSILAPWALPAHASRLSPPSLRRFTSLRAGDHRWPAPVFTALEVAARIYSQGHRTRLFQTRFALRRAASLWAQGREEIQSASRVYAASLSARRLFARNEDAEKILLLDLPLLRIMHDDLDRAAHEHADCGFLRHYRAPDWAIIEQETEIAMADRIIVRGRFAREALGRYGVERESVHISPMAFEHVEGRRRRKDGELRVLLAGLAAARHGAAEVLSILEGRPWLRVVVRDGEGAEPPALLEHPQVIRSADASCSDVDAVIAPCLCEAYLPEVHSAAAAGVPVIATTRGAGAVPRDDLTIELPESVERGLACALDALFGAEPSKHFSPSLVAAALPH